MKNVTLAIVAVVVVLLGSAPPAQAWGGHGRHHGYGFRHGFGVHHGYGFRHGFGVHHRYGFRHGFGVHHRYGFRHGFGGYYRYPYRSHAFSASDVGRQQRTPYVQQQFYWYYCEGANAYYPHVQQCPGGWIKVMPSPSNPSQ
jgi:hypothetical protein